MARNTYLEDLPLLTISDGGATPKSRLKDVAAATEIYTSLKEGDEQSAINRARVQAMFDGVPPYSDSAIRESGQAYRCNLNFGQAEELLPVFLISTFQTSGPFSSFFHSKISPFSAFIS